MLQVPIPPIAPGAAAWDPAAVVVLVAIGAAVGLMLLLPLVRALARRLEGKTADPHLAAEVEDLRQRVAELELQQSHVAELEARVEFAERLLTRDAELRKLGEAQS